MPYNPFENNDLIDIDNDINRLENDQLLFEEINFEQRLEAIDFIGFHILDRLEYLAPDTENQSILISLQSRAKRLLSRLEKINDRIFNTLREDISKGKFERTSFRSAVSQYINLEKLQLTEEGYSNLDLLTNGLFQSIIPEQTRPLEPNMVFYLKTPASVVLDIAKRLKITNKDIFYDLGSGLGQVGILVNLLTNISAIGIEFEPAFCNYAKHCTATLNLKQVKFINGDVLDQDLSPGNIFFMYTPFKDVMLKQVLEKLKRIADTKNITLITYGPCTIEVSKESWLYQTQPGYELNLHTPAFFSRK